MPLARDGAVQWPASNSSSTGSSHASTQPHSLVILLWSCLVWFVGLVWHIWFGVQLIWCWRPGRALTRCAGSSTGLWHASPTHILLLYKGPLAWLDCGTFQKLVLYETWRIGAIHPWSDVAAGHSPLQWFLGQFLVSEKIMRLVSSSAHQCFVSFVPDYRYFQYSTNITAWKGKV